MQPDVEKLRDLWATSKLADNKEITFEKITGPLTRILVSADAEFLDDDVERGRVKCKKIELRLLDYQKPSVNDSRRSADDNFSVSASIAPSALSAAVAGGAAATCSGGIAKGSG